MRRTAGVWYLSALIAVIVGVALLLRPVLFVIVGAAVYACVTWPLTGALAKRVPRVGAVILVNAGIAFIVLAALFVAGPAAYAQARSLIVELPALFGSAAAALPPGVRDVLYAAFRSEAGTAAIWSREAMQAGIGLARSLAGVIVAAIVVPVLGAYLQADYPRYERALFDLVEQPMRGRLSDLLRDLGDVARSFIRAQLIVSSIVGLLVYVVLQAAGIPFAPIIGLATAAADLVPYLGGVAAFLPSILLALAAGGLSKAAIVAVLIAAVFEIEAHVLQPQIVGARTRVPPSLVVLSLLVGGALFGIVGLYLAVPFVASVPILYQFFCTDCYGELAETRAPGLIASDGRTMTRSPEETPARTSA